MKTFFPLLICCLIMWLSFGTGNSFANTPFPTILKQRLYWGSNLTPSTGLHFWKKDTTGVWPEPNKAALYNAIFPGLGQIYNRRYWKLPIVYGALGACIYFAVSNHQQYLDFKDAYRARTDNDPLTIDDYVEQYPDQSTLLSFRESYRRNRDLSIIIGTLAYLLNIVEAYVDAHLRHFDVSDNLSISFQPAFLGAGLKINFR